MHGTASAPRPNVGCAGACGAVNDALPGWIKNNAESWAGWRWRPNARNASKVLPGSKCFLNGFVCAVVWGCIVFGEIFMIHMDSLIVWDDGWTSLTLGDHNDSRIFHLPPRHWETPFLCVFCLFTKLKLTPLQILPGNDFCIDPKWLLFSNRQARGLQSPCMPEKTEPCQRPTRGHPAPFKIARCVGKFETSSLSNAHQYLVWIWFCWMIFYGLGSHQIHRPSFHYHLG